LRGLGLVFYPDANPDNPDTSAVRQAMSGMGASGPADWEAKFPRLFAEHGGRVTMSVAVADAPEAVRRVVALVESLPLAFIRAGEFVALRETDKAAAAEALEAVARATALLDEHHDEVKVWIWHMIW